MLSTPNSTRSASHTHKLPFRKDIQGLRAFAVLLVIAAHAKVSGFEGGFIGVDVFFVISGYLITGLLIKELSSNGQIRFLRFYARRLKRLLPTLALVIITSAFFAYCLLPEPEQLAQATSAAAAIFWVSNIYFTFQNLDYFGTQAAQNIYLHTWSLGVEEQFYLVWPLLLALVFWSTTKKAKYKIALTTTLVVVAIISLFACIWQTSYDARLAFYLTPFRAWQFCVGGLVFLFSERFSSLFKRALPIISLLGLLLIIAGALIVQSATPYPGTYALMPTAGAALLIIAGGGGSKGFATKIMENKIAQGMGNISYSWYLWHWPVFILGGLLLPLSSPVNQLLLISASGALAYTTYHLFENPIRLSRWQEEQHGKQTVAALVLMSIINIGAIHWNNTQHDRIEAGSSAWFTAVRTDLPEIYRLGCDDWFHSSDVKICKLGSDNAEKRVVIFGDSIGLQWFPAIKEIALVENWQLLVITKSACPMANKPYFYPTIGREYTECAEWRTKAIAAIKNMTPDIAILGSTDSYDFSSKQWQEGTESVLHEIGPVTGTTYLIRATPTLGFDGPNCLAKGATDVQELQNQSGCRTSYDTNETSVAWTAINDAAKKFENVKLIDMNGLVCPDSSCAAYRDGVFVYRDGQHLTATFVRSISSELRSMLDAND